MRGLAVIGVPSSAGSYAAGQDQAPRALWEAGLIEALAGAGLDVMDAGHLTEHVWVPDREHRFAQNADEVVASVVELAERVPELLAARGRLLVIGGNCTIAIGVMAGLRVHAGEGCGVLYVDRHFDMNTPATTLEGALDWMGLGHALDLSGALDTFAGAFGERPILTPGQLALLGIDPSEATEFEREQAAALGISLTSQADLVQDPAAAAARALAALPDRPFAVHVDVDVLDFVDAPLSESTNGRNSGPTLDQLGEALAVPVADDRFRALSFGEINPTRSAGDASAIQRLVATVAQVLAG